MFKTFIASDEDYNTFTRPAVYDSIRRVLKFYGLDNVAEIYYNGEAEIASQVGTVSSETVRDTRFTDGVYRNKLYIVPEIEHNEYNSGFSNQRRSATEKVFWEDKTLPLSITPAFESRTVRVGVVGYFNSRDTAKQFVNKINRLQANQAVAFNFSANTHLVINPEIIEFFKVVHGLVAKNDPTTPELADWFDNGKQHAVTTVSNVNGNLKRMVFPLQLNNIGIYFDEPQIKLARKQETYGRYEVTLSYYFYFQEFTGYELVYPLNVYQDEIPAKYIPKPDPGHVEPFDLKVSPELEAARVLGYPGNNGRHPFYLRLPQHDPWTPPQQDWLEPIIQARLRLKDVDKQPLCNLFEIPGYNWNPKVKAYVLRRYDRVQHINQLPVLVQVYSDNQKVDPARISMDSTGVVYMDSNPVMTNTYRVVVIYNCAIRDYSESMWRDLRANPDDLSIIESFFPGYPWNQFDSHWINHLDVVRKEIHKGYGLPTNDLGNYMMDLDTIAHKY